MLTDKEKCNALLILLVGKGEAFEKWWVSPNKAFWMETPLNVFKRDSDKVLSYLASSVFR